MVWEKSFFLLLLILTWAAADAIKTSPYDHHIEFIEIKIWSDNGHITV